MYQLLLFCKLTLMLKTIDAKNVYYTQLQGMYSGMVDTSKINKKEFNWMRNIND